MASKPLVFLLLLVIFGFALTCTATTYIVGDNSGWDISTDLDSWTEDKIFSVGDVLLFQYSSTHSVNEVTRENYQGCNTTNVLQSGSNGNTSFALTQPGDRYFICGNKLHCYGGMKLQVLTQEAQATATSPASAPQPQSGGGSSSLPQPQSGGGSSSLPQPSSKSNNPSTVTPSSAMFYRVGILDSLFIAFLCVIASTLPWIL